MPEVFNDESITLVLLFRYSFCWRCKFCSDCKRKVLRKEIDNPFCFKDSKRHDLFLKEYGNMMSIVDEEEPIPELDIAEQ